MDDLATAKRAPYLALPVLWILGLIYLGPGPVLLLMLVLMATRKHKRGFREVDTRPESRAGRVRR